MLFELPCSHLARTNDEWGKPARPESQVLEPGSGEPETGNRVQYYCDCSDHSFLVLPYTKYELIGTLELRNPLSIEKWRNRDRQCFIDKSINGLMFVSFRNGTLN